MHHLAVADPDLEWGDGNKHEIYVTASSGHFFQINDNDACTNYGPSPVNSINQWDPSSWHHFHSQTVMGYPCHKKNSVAWYSTVAQIPQNHYLSLCHGGMRYIVFLSTDEGKLLLQHILFDEKFFISFPHKTCFYLVFYNKNAYQHCVAPHFSPWLNPNFACTSFSQTLKNQSLFRMSWSTFWLCNFWYPNFFLEFW